MGTGVEGKGSGLVRIEDGDISRSLIMKDLMSYTKEVKFYPKSSVQLLFLRPEWDRFTSPDRSSYHMVTTLE